jgi:hypothetical protein
MNDFTISWALSVIGPGGFMPTSSPMWPPVELPRMPTVEGSPCQPGAFLRPS